MKNYLMICGIVLALLAPSSMFADTIFDFNFYAFYIHGDPGFPFAGSGKLDTQATGTPGEFVVTGVSGSTYNTAIAGLTGGPGTLTLASISGEPVASVHFDYQLSDGMTVDVSPGTLLSYPGHTLVYVSNFPNGSYLGEVGAVDFYATPEPSVVAITPEPETLILLSTGGLGIVMTLRRRLFT